MPSPDSKARARAELLNLIELQTLEKETFGVLTEAELCEYQDRCDRIRRLYAQIIQSGEAAA